MNKPDLALNNLQWLINHKTKTNLMRRDMERSKKIKKKTNA